MPMLWPVQWAEMIHTIFKPGPLKTPAHSSYPGFPPVNQLVANNPEEDFNSL